MYFSDYSIEWQHVFLLMYSLDNITGGIPTKQQTIEFIQREGLILLRDEDFKPYPTQNEPSWCTDIAWARKNAVMLGYVNNHEWDSWEISRPGREFLNHILSNGKRGKFMVGRCFLWSHTMRHIVDPAYIPSLNDPAAPPKGERSLPDIKELQELFSTISKVVSLPQIAEGFSKKLGVHIPSTPPSLAFAWWTITKDQQNNAQ